MKVCMLVRKVARDDPRVRREAAALHAAGHEVVVIGLRPPGLPAHGRVDHARVIRIPGLSQRLRRARRRPRRPQAPGQLPTPPQGLTVRLGEWHWVASAVAAGVAERADVYHAHDLDTLHAAHRCARLTRARLVYDSHELWLDWRTGAGHAPWLMARWRRAEAAGYRAADRVITVSEPLARALQAQYGGPRPAVIRNCAPLTPLTPGGGLRALIGGDPGRPLVVYQGTFAADRGLEELAQAAAQVPQADFVLLGRPSPLRAALVAASAHLPNVYLPPAVAPAELPALTQSADLGVVLTQPVNRSYAGSLSNKIFEYMSAGCAVLASDLESHRALVASTGAVAVAPSIEPNALAAQIRALLADPRRLARMGAAGRRAAEGGLNAQAEFSRLASLYAELEATRPAARLGGSARRGGAQ